MVFNFTNLFYNNDSDIDNNKKLITVKNICNLLQESKLVRLNITDNLSVIRQELEKNYDIDDTLLFLRKYSVNNNESYEFAEIALNDDEEIIHLNEIIDNDILYIKCKVKIDWNFLNNLRKLDYGCAMTFDEIKKASKRAFQMKNCELTEIGTEGCKKGVIEFGSNEDWMMK